MKHLSHILLLPAIFVMLVINSEAQESEDLKLWLQNNKRSAENAPKEREKSTEQFVGRMAIKTSDTDQPIIIKGDSNFFLPEQFNLYYNKSISTEENENSWRTNMDEIVVFPSPNSSSIINNIAENIDLYTGRLNLSLPLYTLKSHEISLPISLSYSTTGNKVDDIAGWVGLGWNLNAGGSISRVMKDLPDEFEGVIGPNCQYGWGGSPCEAIPAYGYLNIKNRDVNIGNFSNESNEKKRKIVKYSNWKTLDGIDHGDGFGTGEAWDTQPDEFYFSFGEYSGKFVFDQDGNIYTIPHANLKIEKTISYFSIDGVQVPKITSFNVTTENGFQYMFGDENLSCVEESKLERTILNSNYMYEYAGPYVLPDGLILYFYYRYPLLNQIVQDGSIMNDTYNVRGNTALSIYNFFTSTWALKKIIGPNKDEVSFLYDEGEEIRYTQGRNHTIKIPNLSEIESNDGWYFVSPEPPVTNSAEKSVYNTYQSFTYTIEEVIVKPKRLNSITASNGYSVSFQALTNRADLYGDKRLDKIEISNGNAVIKSYIFDYKNVATTLQYDYFDLTSFDALVYNIDGPYIDSDITFIDQKYKILAQNDPDINQYEYVQNYANIFASEHFRQYLTKVTEVGKNNVLKPSYDFNYNSTVLPRRFSYKSDYYGYFNQNTRGTTIRKISYIGAGGDAVARSNITLIGWDNLSGGEYSYRGASLSSSFSQSQAGILEEIRYPTGGLTKYYYTLNSINEMTSCGLRVEKQTRFPNSLSMDESITEQYSYSLGRQASGMLFEYSLASSELGGKDIFSNSDFTIPGSLTKGGPVGYQKAKRYQVNNGFNSYVFRSPIDIGNSNSLVYEVEEENPSPNRFPFPPQLDRDWQRGMVTESMATLLAENDILAKVNDDYIFQPENFNMVEISGLIPGIFYIDGHPRYRAGIYKYQSGWYYKDKTTNTVFSSTNPGDEGKAVVNQVDYDYKVIAHDDLQYTFLDSQREINSKGQPQEITYTYPLDVSNPTDVLTTQPVIDELISKHMLSTVLKTEKSNNYNKVEGQINTYRVELNEDDSTMVLPSITNLLEGEAYKPKVYYDKYDDKGNIIEYHEKDNYYTTFLWGYNYQYPVAKIENAEYSYVMGQMNNILYTDLQSKTSEQLLSIFNTLRQKPEMADKTVYSYTYDPLIGMTSETDPNGNTLKYIYDDFNRLETITDKEDMVLKHVDYHYSFHASLKHNSSYHHGEIATFELEGIPDENSFTYEWSIMNNGTFASGSSKDLTVQLTKSGNYYIICKITENETGYIQTLTGAFYVYPINCTFLDIVQHTYNTGDNSYTSTATLQSPWNEVVSLQIWCNSVGTNATNVVRVIIGDHPFNNIQSGTTLIEVPITFTNLNCEIFAQGTDRQHIMLTILSVQNNTTDLIDPLVLQLSKP